MIGDDAFYFFDLESTSGSAIRDDEHDEHRDPQQGSNTPHHV